MLTMLTYIAHINIGKYKNPFKCFETILVTLFWLLFVPKNKREFPKIMPDDPKIFAWQSSGIISGIPKNVPDN